MSCCPQHELAEFCALIIGGGNDTTTGLVANALIWLSEHPDARNWLREDPSRLRAPARSSCATSRPTQALARTVRKPVEIGGYELQPGDRVLLSFASANHDPAEFDNPDEIKLDRFPNRHQAFGLGLHRCLGSNFTRMEFRVVLEEVLERMPDFVVDRSGSERYGTSASSTAGHHAATFTPGPRLGSTFQP